MPCTSTAIVSPWAAHVAAFLGEGIRRDEIGVVVATEDMRQAIRTQLLRTIPHLDALPDYTALDADELLSNFLVNATPDRERFFHVMDQVFSQSAQARRSIRVYGEMVALLCHGGRPAAALHLEELWNLLAKRYAFSLLCGYPKSVFEAQDSQWLLNTCVTHSQLSIVSDSGPNKAVCHA
jgi:hypothetical protein